MKTLEPSWIRLTLALTFAGWAALTYACGATTGVGECSTNADCFEGYACDVAQTKICMRACEADTDCLGGDAADREFCDIISGETTGVCRGPDATVE